MDQPVVQTGQSRLHNVNDLQGCSMRGYAFHVLEADCFCRSCCCVVRPSWWSQTGSNRRPHACKARALPTELWPRDQMVGPGRVERPTSRLSGVRSNHLSYEPGSCSNIARYRTGATSTERGRETKTAATVCRCLVSTEKPHECD